MSCSEVYFKDEERVFSLLATVGFVPRTIYDIGASNGFWSARMSETFPHSAFHLFEPLANLIPSYQEGLELQMRDHPSFTVHEIALGSGNTPITMRIDAEAFGSTILNMDEHPDYQRRFEVAQRRLDDFVDQASLPLPDLIKIDVQGAERVILSHASRCLDHADVVFAETWFVRGYGPETPLITELAGLLAQHDYVLAELGQKFYYSNHQLYSCDAFFAKRSLLDRVASRLPQSPW